MSRPSIHCPDLFQPELRLFYMKIYPKAQDKPKERHDTLPLDRPVALYYRQSDPDQVGNEETYYQQVRQVDLLIEMGWRREDIIEIFQDEGVSGTLDILDRPGMRELFDLINADKIGAVAVASV